MSEMTKISGGVFSDAIEGGRAGAEIEMTANEIIARQANGEDASSQRQGVPHRGTPFADALIPQGGPEHINAKQTIAAQVMTTSVSEAIAHMGRVMRKIGKHVPPAGERDSLEPASTGA